MVKSCRELKIPIFGRLRAGDQIGVLVVIARKDGLLDELSEADAEEKGVSRWQLCECSRYEYHLSDNYTFNLGEDFPDAIIQQSRLEDRSNEGHIRTGSFVGRIVKKVYDFEGREVGEVEFEVRSNKLDYIAQYRHMLNGIAEKCDELLMLQSSPVLQTFDVNMNEDAKTLYERFVFLKSILDNEEFVSAVQRICINPMESLMTVSEEVPVSRSHRIGRSVIRQLVGSSDRVELSDSDELRAYGISSLPRKLELESRELTRDTAENRFIKFALTTFAGFLEDLREHPCAGEALKKESAGLIEKFETLLSDPFFREVGRMRRLPLQSPLLQRREGYRQVLRSWILFDCAAKFVWKGGDDVYDAGKRDVATLYEYWVYFQLYEAVCKVFKLDAKSSDELVKVADNKMAIRLRRGKILDLNASSECGRKLHVRFSYNRSFSPDELKSSGTWTTGMRPDYTLSIWPGDLNEKSAESAEAIVHVHFDAKYRLDHIEDIFGNRDSGGDKNSKVEDDDDSDHKVRDEAKREEAEYIYKQGDLLKMHAYNDAIRRTYGSYIIYPGDDNNPELMREYHELLPGLGAFALRPADGAAEGLDNIVKFISDVRDVMVDRMTQRERAAVSRARIYAHAPRSNALEQLNLPDYEKGIYPPVPAEEKVLVGYCKLDQMKWVGKNRLYNFRCEKGLRGSITITADFAGARYLLIHSEPEDKYPPILLELEDERCVMSASELKALKYPNKRPSAKMYWVVKIKQMLWCDRKVDIELLDGFSEAGNVPGKSAEHLPFVSSLESVLMHMHRPSTSLWNLKIPVYGKE